MSEQDSNWRYVDEIVVEPDAMVRARQRSLELGIDAVGPAVAAQLSLIAAASRATQIIEIGTGAGVSGLSLLRPSRRSVLTTIDVEPEHLGAARDTFHDAVVPASRVRLITGRALEVLPRMNEKTYDIVLVDADPERVIEYVEHGLRLVRAGGTVLVPHALWRGRVSDPAQRDEQTRLFRSLVSEIALSPAVMSAVSPAGDGVLQLTTLA